MSKKTEYLELEVLVKDQSLASLRAQLKLLKKDFENAKPNTAEFDRYAASLRVTKAEIAKLNSEVTQSNARYFQLGTTIREVVAAGMKLYATFYVLRRAFEFAEEGAKAEQAFASFAATVETHGKNAAAVLDDLKRRAGGIIDDSDIARIATKAVSLGVPVEKLGELMSIARAKAREMGISASDAFSTITNSIGRARPMMLHTVGIAMNSREAFNEMGEAIGESASKLSLHEKQQAVLNQVLEEGTSTLKRHNLEILTNAERLLLVKARIQEIKEEIGTWLLRLQFLVVAIVAEIKALFATLYMHIANVFALIEKGENFLGLSKSTYFQRLGENAKKLADKYTGEAADALKGLFADSKDLAAAMHSTTEETDYASDSTDKYAKTMERAAKGSEKFAESVRKRDLSLIESFDPELAKRIRAFNELREQMGAEGSTRRQASRAGYAATMRSTKLKGERVDVKGSTGVEAIDKTIADEQSQLKDTVEGYVNLGEAVGYNFAQGIQQGVPAIRAAFKSILVEMINYLERQYVAAQIGNLLKNFMTLGVAGIVKGIAEVAALTALFGAAKSKIMSYGEGGLIQEPVLGLGVSGRRYLIGERGPEMVTPLSRASDIAQSSRGSSVAAMLGRVERAVLDLQTRFRFELAGLDLVAAYRKNAAIVTDRGM